MDEGYWSFDALYSIDHQKVRRLEHITREHR